MVLRNARSTDVSRPRLAHVVPAITNMAMRGGGSSWKDADSDNAPDSETHEIQYLGSVSFNEAFVVSAKVAKHEVRA